MNDSLTPPLAHEAPYIRRPVHKTLLAHLRQCERRGSWAVQGVWGDVPPQSLSPLLATYIALHKALAALFRTWSKGDRVNVRPAAMQQLWARSWGSTGIKMPPDPEGAERLRVYVEIHEPLYVGRDRCARILFVERTLRASHQLAPGITFSAAPDVVVLSLDEARQRLVAIEHTSKAHPLLSRDEVETMALLDQLVLGRSAELPEYLVPGHGKVSVGGRGGPRRWPSESPPVAKQVPSPGC